MKTLRSRLSGLLELVRTEKRLVASIVASMIIIAGGSHIISELAAARLLRHEAEADAHAWVRRVDVAVGEELPLILRGDAPSSWASMAIDHGRRAGVIYSYTLFDASGRLVLTSAGRAGVDGTSADDRGASEDRTSRMARGAPPGRPAHFADVRVAVPAGDGQPDGFFEVIVDLTARRDRFRRTLLMTEGIMICVVFLAALIPGGHAWRKARDRETAAEWVRFLAHNDALTGIANRASFGMALNAALSRSRRERTSLAILSIDLDRFKEANDTHGHAAGDAVLIEIAERIRGLIREEDVVARLGGDEFIVLQANQKQPQGATSLAERLLQALCEPIALPDGRVLAMSGSVGVALTPSDGDMPEMLLQAADAALYRAKQDGRGVVRFHEPAMEAAMRARRRLGLELKDAVQAGELTLAFQPLVRLSDRRVTGFEALARWMHPQDGAIPPSEFVPLAEETGLIVPLGAWVLAEACRQAASWPGEATIAVNLSPAQFREPEKLIATVQQALFESGLPANRLELEVTEGTLIVDVERALLILNALRALGCRIAMDDFGTGYSSLAYLWRFPFDKLKIDRGFVLGLQNQPKAAAIVATIAALGKLLGLTVTAEGIETEVQAEALLRAGCDQGQGYALGRPGTAEEAAKLLVPSYTSDTVLLATSA